MKPRIKRTKSSRYQYTIHRWYRSVYTFWRSDISPITMAHPGGVHCVVPFIGMIPGGMMPGKKISIHGMVIPTCNRFSVNLQCGPNVNPRDDIALHMNFRYDQQVPYVVRNSLQMQQWGIEEGHGYLSFARGQTFEIQIHAEHDHFKVHFNGNHFTDFRYRVPLQRVTYVAIDGEVALHGVKVDGYDVAPHRAGMGFGMTPPFGMHQPGMPAHGMSVPAHAAPMYPGYPVGMHPPMHSGAIPVAVGVGAGMAMGTHMDKKMMKKQKKAMKKAMKHNKHSHHGMHGYPHHGGHHGGHHGHHKGSSSSSSSSSSEEE